MCIEKFLSLTLSLLTVLALLVMVEPGVAKGVTSSDVLGLIVYVTEDITISAPETTTLGTINLSTPDVNNYAVWTVTTNATGGYTLKLKAATADVLKSANDQIDDYTAVTATVPEAWSIAASAYEFGWGTHGTGNTDVASGTWGSGNNCTGAYYLDPDTTQSITFASRTSETSSSGIDTIVCFRVAQGDNVYIPSGTYTGTVTAYAATQ